jgi:hypothetical protein
MKTRHYINFHVPRPEGDRFRDLMHTIGCLKLWQEPLNERALPHLAYTFDADDPRLSQLLNLLDREGIDWFERIDYLFSDKELRGFPMLVLGGIGAPIDGGNPKQGTLYDLSGGCVACGTGAPQTSPLFAGESGLKKKKVMCATYYGHLLCDLDVADALGVSKFRGLELRQARSYRKIPMPWWQVLADCVMPKMSSGASYVVRDSSTGWGCPVCQRDMHATRMSVPPIVVYEQSSVSLDELPDFVQTWERFGRSIIRDDPERHLLSGFAQPWILVKQRVFEFFLHRKFRNKMSFSPVRFE